MEDSVNRKKILSVLAPVDVISIIFLFFLTGLNLLFYRRIPAWMEITAVNLAVIAAIFVLASTAAACRTALWTGLHRFYNYAIVFFVFKEIYLMVHPIHPVDYDALFISLDYWIFGVNPTQWATRFAHPVLTEIFQTAYFSYYILFILLGVELYRRKGVETFDEGAFLIVYGFYLSYLGYFLLPAVGPRFTLHDFYAINSELPGLLCTSWMRDFINAGESISFTMAHASEFVQRDVFPSGHTQLTLLVISLAFRYKLKTRWIMTVLGFLLVLGTIYLRYHYVVDLLGGCIFFAVTLWTGKWIQAQWKTKGGIGDRTVRE